ncbi:MAG: hypothetical protein Q4D98_08245 [Planctomycetia bacterium]|nr:hypothetical protein [Planctomycetia bacterium]
MVRKRKKIEVSPIRNFFRRIALLGMLLAGGVLFYSASQPSTQIVEPNAADTTFREETRHTTAYPDTETPEANPDASTTTSFSPIAAENYNGGYVEMQGHDSETPETASVEPPVEEKAVPETSPAEASPEETSEPTVETSSTVSPEVPTTPAAIIPPVESTPVSSETPPTTPPLISRPATPPLKNVTGPPVNNFLEIFDFNVNPDWVTARWSYVTTVGPLNTRGFRVPLCTGTSKSDLVGNLTYYFDRNLDVEKITFEGYTGDLDRLILTLRYFHMEKRMTADPNVLLYESPTLANNYKSYMKSYFRTTSITENPNQRFWITMELYPEDEE